MLSPAIMRELKAVDWNFPKASSELFRSPHWYPGTFPPELPSALIQATTMPGDLIFDPYAGVGTTSTEALRLKRRSWCVELNRIAALTAYVSGAVLLIRERHPKVLDTLLNSLARKVAASEGGELFAEPPSTENHTDVDELVGTLVRPAPGQFLDQLLFAPEVNAEALSVWYHAKILEQILRYTESLANQDSVTLRLLGLMALSANLKAMSSQTRSWGHIADNVRPKVLINKDLPSGLRRWFGRFCSSLGRTNLHTVPNVPEIEAPYLHVSLHNWTEPGSVLPKPSQSSTALITSPPYGGAIDYVLSQRLSYYLLGADEDALIAEQRNEVGARRRRFSDKSRDVWAQSLCTCVERQLEYLDQAGTVVLVMPHKSEGRANGSEVVDDTLKSLCWVKQFSIDRSIRTQRTRQAWTSIKRETISIYGRDDSPVQEGA